MKEIAKRASKSILNNVVADSKALLRELDQKDLELDKVDLESRDSMNCHSK